MLKNPPKLAILALANLALLSSLLFPSTANAVTVDQITWLNPPAGSMTSPGAFTPSIDGVTGGVMRSMTATLIFASSTCSDNWTDLANAATINLENGKCYKWTMDPTVDSNSVKPNEKVTDQSSLTSGVLKVSDSACHMNSQWDGSVVTITYGLPNPASGIDCKTEFTTPKNVGKIDYLLVGGGGAGGWAGTTRSDGGGGGGGGGASFSSINASVTPGRTYLIQVGAGAIAGTRSTGNISCRRGLVGDSAVSVQTAGGTSTLGKFTAEGGGCAIDTGGNERGSDGGISANGRTGGRGGSSVSRPQRCTPLGGVARINLVRTTTYYTTAPCVLDEAATAIAGVGNGTGGGGNYWLNAWEGGGGGGGAWFPTLSDGNLDLNGACVYGNPHWNFFNGCDGWDISGVGAFGGIGGRGIQSTWYQGSCNYYFGGGGGGGGSTSYGDVGWTFAGSKWEYRWNAVENRTELSSVASGDSLNIPNWAPLGGPGGLGGGGQGATSTTNRSTSEPTNAHYQHAQDGADGCGGGGGGGQANKVGAYRYSATSANLYDDHGDPIFEHAGVQFEAARDGSNQRIQLIHPTVPSWYNVYLYQEIGHTGNQIYVDDWGNVYSAVTNDWLGAGYPDSSSNPNNLELVNSIGTPIAEVYQFDVHTYTINSSNALDSYTHDGDLYTEYSDENGRTVYLDQWGASFHIIDGYVNVEVYSQATSTLSAEPTAQTLDEPGKGGNGLVAIRFSLTSNFGSTYNPALKVPSIQKIWPNLSEVIVPISLKQSDGSGYICINLADPANPANDFSGTSSIRFKLGNSSGASLTQSQVASQLKTLLAKLGIGKSISDYLIRDADSWVTNKKLVLKVRYSGSDSIATNSCDNSVSDLPVGGTPLVQYLTLERLSATQVRTLQVLPKNGRQNN